MTVTNFIWDELSDNVLMETDENNVPTVVYTHRPERFGQLISQERSGTTSYFIYDGANSTRLLTDDNEAITDTYIFSAYGELVARTGTTTNPFGYKGAVGYYTNSATNDIYVRARTYQPVTGRWLSQDPLRFVDGPNLYRAYFVPDGLDPTGRATWHDDPPGAAGEHTGTTEYEDPPSTPFVIKGRCRIAVKCFYPAGILWRHCGLVIILWDGIYTVDGTGGDQNNFDWTGVTHDRFGHNFENGLMGPYVDYDISVCECLRSNSVKWNSLDIPRTDLGFNSNTSLGCLLKRCNLKIDFTWDPQSYEKECCAEWGERYSPSEKCNVPYCFSWVSCCDTVKGW